MSALYGVRFNTTLSASIVLQAKRAKEADPDTTAPKKKRSKHETANVDKAAAASVDWQSMALSRPLLRAINELGFKNPTPIQAGAIPPALAGRDICGSARPARKRFRVSICAARTLNG